MSLFGAAMRGQPLGWFLQATLSTDDDDGEKKDWSASAAAVSAGSSLRLWIATMGERAGSTGSSFKLDDGEKEVAEVLVFNLLVAVVEGSRLDKGRLVEQRSVRIMLAALHSLSPEKKENITNNCVETDKFMVRKLDMQNIEM